VRGAGHASASQVVTVPVSRTKIADVREQLVRAVESVKRQDFGAAMEQLKSILAADPRHVLALGMLAGVYAELKMPEQAEMHYQRVLEIEPGNVLARFQLGLMQLSAGRARDAIQTWEPSLRDPKDYLSHFHSALAHLQLGESARARELLDLASKHMPASHALCSQLRDLRQKLVAEAHESSIRH
jgi:Tfp pilus assembly protein PilF